MAQVKIPFDEKEAVRYFGAKKDDREAARLVDEAFIALRNEVQPRAVKRRLSCRVTPPCDGGSLKATSLPTTFWAVRK